VFLGFCEHLNEHMDSINEDILVYRLEFRKLEQKVSETGFVLALSLMFAPIRVGPLETAGENPWSVGQLSVSQQ